MIRRRPSAVDDGSRMQISSSARGGQKEVPPTQCGNTTDVPAIGGAGAVKSSLNRPGHLARAWPRWCAPGTVAGRPAGARGAHQSVDLLMVYLPISLLRSVVGLGSDPG